MLLQPTSLYGFPFCQIRGPHCHLVLSKLTTRPHIVFAVAVSTSSTSNLTNGYRTSSISSLDDAPGLVCDDSDSIFSLESLEEADFFNEPVDFDSAVNSPQPPTPAVAASKSVEKRAAMTPPVSGKNSPRPSSKQSFAEATTSYIKNAVLQQIFKSAQQSKKAVAKEPSSNQVK